MPTNYDQSRIWAYHQNENVDSFGGAAPRLQGLAKAVFRLARRQRITRPAVLNIGVGNGYLEELIMRDGGDAYSVDPDERALTRLAGKGVKCYVGKIEDLPFGDGELDFVVVSEVLEHLDDAERSRGLAEIRRVLGIRQAWRLRSGYRSLSGKCATKYDDLPPLRGSFSPVGT